MTTGITDVEWLDANICKLSAENERLRTMLKEAHDRWDDCLNRSTQWREERDQLYGYVNGLLGLLQIVRNRDDMPQAIAEVLRFNHRATDAGAYLTQIVPPSNDEQTGSGK